MATEKLVELLQLQLEQQKAYMSTQEARHQDQMEAIISMFKKTSESGETATRVTALPNFPAFDSASELWLDYLARFETYVEAHSVAEEKKAHVFLTNQTPVVYKLLSNLAGQQEPPKDVNHLSFHEISNFMMEQFHPKRFIVRERYKFWSNINRKPGETIQELVARIRQDAITCDFPSITNPLDEAMRTRFICSVNNEAVLKALFKVKDNELTFAKAIELAQETEDAAKVAKETVYGSKTASSTTTVYKIDRNVKGNKGSQHSTFKCIRCGQPGHKPSECKYKSTKCHYCEKIGHLEKACLKKKKESEDLKNSKKSKTKKINSVLLVPNQQDVKEVPELQVPIKLDGQHLVNFEVDTGAAENFLGENVWKDLGKPKLQDSGRRFESASQDPLPVLGSVALSAQVDQSQQQTIGFNVTKVPDLNLLGRDSIKQLGISVDALLEQNIPSDSPAKEVNTVFDKLVADKDLQMACRQLCDEFPDLFKPELGTLKNFELDIKFKTDAKPVFSKPRPVPFALQDDLEEAYEAGIKRGIWEPTQFNAYGTPVVPIRKPPLPGQTKGKLRVCGDYSVAVNAQLETHRHPMPSPEKLLQKLSGGYGFTKIDLADAYNQIPLSSDSQRKLALSTHKGVLLQKRLPFGISSAPGYFQEIMDQLTNDLPGVAVYFDDILVSGTSAQDHLSNLRGLLQRLNNNGLRCRLEKCHFAQPYVEYLGHLLSSEGIAKGSKIDAVMKMPPPTNVSSLKSFLGSVQFYSKFLPNLSTVLDPLYNLTKKETQWKWNAEEQAAFDKVKSMLSAETVLVHYNPSRPVGIACDASEVGVGAVLFHRYPDGSERPITNVSKTLTNTQRKYSQIQREALSIVFAVKKFHQFLYGKKFILVTDHKPLVALFSPTKATPALAANRLARWALNLGQYDYTIEYRKTADHGNADALSRLPEGPDPDFDGEESSSDADTICMVKTISLQIDPTDPTLVAKETSKDPVLGIVMRYTREGWPLSTGKGEQSTNSTQAFKHIKDSLTVTDGCLFYGLRLVIPTSLQAKVLNILHLGHFGMQRMKQLARTAVYWPGIDSCIMDLCRGCHACAEHQNKPPKPPVHPWMFPEKPWSRVHVDHAINFLGSNWFVLVDAYSKYPCIHATSSVSTKATIELLEEDFAHFGYPHTIVSDNATCFTSAEFQEWCKSRGIVHLTGAPYHPATNGAAERLVQSFKRSVQKSSLPPKAALQQFLIQYRRTPLVTGYSPSELLNGRQIRTLIDTLAPSPAHQAQGHHCKLATQGPQKVVSRKYTLGMPCYALYCGPRRDKDPRWVPAVVTKVFGTRSVNVKVLPKGPTWRRHIEQLRPRYTSSEDAEPGETPVVSCPTVTAPEEQVEPNNSQVEQEKEPSPQAGPPAKPKRKNPRLPTGDEFGPDNPRRSERIKKKYKH